MRVTVRISRDDESDGALDGAHIERAEAGLLECGRINAVILIDSRVQNFDGSAAFTESRDLSMALINPFWGIATRIKGGGAIVLVACDLTVQGSTFSFVGIRGSGYMGDMAIDEVIVRMATIYRRAPAAIRTVGLESVHQKAASLCLQ